MGMVGSKNTRGIRKSHAELHKATLHYMQCHNLTSEHNSKASNKHHNY